MSRDGETLKNPEAVLWVADYPSSYAAKTPDKAALICGDEVISSARLDEQSNNVVAILQDMARWFKACGVTSVAMESTRGLLNPGL